MKQQSPPFDPHEFAKWFVDGLKETISYRVKQTLNREKILEALQAKVPTRNQVLHRVLRAAFEKNGFHFEEIKQGDATFHLIRKKLREVAPGNEVRRFVLIPGFGDTPASWIPSFGFSRSDLMKNYDELLIADFPGYLGFLSSHSMVPSMAVLLGFLKTVLEANPPTTLVGHSLGGWLAARVAQEMDHTLEHLVLIAPSGLIPEAERQAFADLIVGSQGMSMDQLMEKVIHEPKKYHHLVQEEIMAFYSQSEVREFVMSVTPEQFVDPKVPFHAKKLTVIWGEGDQFVPAHWLRFWVEHFGDNLNAYVMKNTGHLVQLERPKVLSDVLMNAILDRPSAEGSGWKRVHQRKREIHRIESKSKSARLLT